MDTTTETTTISIEPLDATLGAIITGVELADLDDDTWTVIEAAFNQHAVLIFPGQHLSDDQQKAFGARFGPLETISGATGLSLLSNVAKDGTLRDGDDVMIGIMKGNEGWHTDSSYMEISAKASMLSAHVVPPEGGETEWADMRAAYDALPDDRKQQIEDLAAFHSLVHSQQKAGYDNPGTAFTYGFEGGPDPFRPLVKVHPDTGRRALYIGRHAFGIPGLEPDESDRLLAELLELACQPPRTYKHTWTPGDLVVWDNRCVLHRARPFDLSHPRVMKHTRITGDPVTEASLPRPT